MKPQALPEDCIRIAREIAIETDAVNQSGQPWLDRVGSINIDCQLLACNIGAQRIRAGELDVNHGDLMHALEQVFEEASHQAI